MSSYIFLSDLLPCVFKKEEKKNEETRSVVCGLNLGNIWTELNKVNLKFVANTFFHQFRIGKYGTIILCAVCAFLIQLF